MQEGGTSHGLPMDVVGKAVAFPFTHFLTMLKIGLLPWLLSYLVAYGIIVFFSPDKAHEFSSVKIALFSQDSVVPKLLTNLTDVFVAAIVAVGIHRTIISDERPNWTSIRLGRNDIAYLVVGGIVYLAFIAPIYIFLVIQKIVVPSAQTQIDWFGLIDPDRIPFLSIVPQLAVGSPWVMLVYLVALAVGILFNIRFSMAFPHAAVSGAVSLRAAQAIMKNNFFKFIGLAIEFVFVVVVINLPMAYVFYLGVTPYVSPEGVVTTRISAQFLYAIEYANLFLELIFFSMMIAFISYCYVAFTGGIVGQRVTDTHT